VAAGDQEVTDFYEQFERRVADLPSVLSVGDGSTLHLGEDLDYFQEVSFVDREVASEVDPRAVLRPVNEAFAEQFYTGEDPIGEKIGRMQMRLGPLGAIHVAAGITESEIIGVVKDMKYDGLRSDATPALYFSGLQSSIRRRTIAIRSSGDPASLLPAVRRELAAMNPSVALTNIRTMNDVVADARSRDRFSTLLLSTFGILALILASVGVYGVLSYTVAQRRSEVGIRMALGADGGAVRTMILNDGLKLVIAGLVVGVVGAVALSGLLTTQLYGVNPREPMIYLGVTTTLLVAGVAACLIPAWGATRVNPITAMRAE
jgi:hypothetical protein